MVENIKNKIIHYAMQLYSDGAPVEELLDRMFNEILELRAKVNLGCIIDENNGDKQ